jgi:hypothetical protein
MSLSKDLANLQLLAGLMLDHRLSTLQHAAAAIRESRLALERLSAPPPTVEGLQGAAAALSALAYHRWADARRAEINTALARQTHDWMVAQDAARTAFGKAEALKGVASKLAGKRL